MNKPTLGNLINDRFPAHDPDVKQLFGLDKKAKWPNEGMPKRLINGVACWVDPILPLNPVTKRRRFVLRASCFCPQCGTVTPIGRLAQHEGTKTCIKKASK